MIPLSLPPKQAEYSAVATHEDNRNKPLVVVYYEKCQKQEPKIVFCELPDDLKVKTTTTTTSGNMFSANASLAYGTTSTTTT